MKQLYKLHKAATACSEGQEKDTAEEQTGRSCGCLCSGYQSFFTVHSPRWLAFNLFFFLFDGCKVSCQQISCSKWIGITSLQVPIFPSKEGSSFMIWHYVCQAFLSAASIFPNLQYTIISSCRSGIFIKLFHSKNTLWKYMLNVTFLGHLEKLFLV